VLAVRRLKGVGCMATGGGMLCCFLFYEMSIGK
jgi:hypothetical protein